MAQSCSAQFIPPSIKPEISWALNSSNLNAKSGFSNDPKLFVLLLLLIARHPARQICHCQGDIFTAVAGSSDNVTDIAVGQLESEVSGVGPGVGLVHREWTLDGRRREFDS